MQCDVTSVLRHREHSDVLKFALDDYEIDEVKKVASAINMASVSVLRCLGLEAASRPGDSPRSSLGRNLQRLGLGIK